MEKSLIVNKESKYYKDLMQYIECSEQQRKFVFKFLKEKGIEAERYYIGGDGMCNCAFDKYLKGNIRLHILPTENDLNKFGKMLTKADTYGLQTFKKNSVITKDFADRCINEKIIINLLEPDFRDYFKSIDWQAYSYKQFEYNSQLYLKITSEALKADDIPEGFTEIKLSEFYKAMEEYEASKGDK